RNNLSSADATSGAHIELEVLDDVKVDGLTVIARGTRATGTITQAEHKKSMARGGKLGITIDSVPLVTDDRVALRGTKEATAGGHTGAMTAGIVTGALIFWPAAPFFLFIHGKEAVVPAGTEITAYTQGHIKLERSKLLAKVAMR
ncbi:MAG: PEGA domain-containing protein, partial [Acidobacteriaceae bacterium]|nr:PEGA domain-containing protein [Acidobacteriaceae bacterium]